MYRDLYFQFKNAYSIEIIYKIGTKIPMQSREEFVGITSHFPYFTPSTPIRMAMYPPTFSAFGLK